MIGTVNSRIRKLETLLKEEMRRVDRILENMETHKSIEHYYIELIRGYVEREAQVAVAKMLEHPIEMTIEDIEKAFNHKVKIVESKE